MDFRTILKLLYEGHKVKLPEWKGYWYVKDNLIYVHTKDNEDVETPWFEQYINRNDWEVL